MYCKHCGKIIDDDSHFCQYCGNAVTPTEFSETKLYEDILNAGTTIVETPKGKYIIAGDIKTGYVILDITNNMPVFNTIFEEIYWDGYGNGYSEHQWVKKNGKWGYVDALKGSILCNFIYDHFEIHEFFQDYADVFTVYSDGLCGSLDYDGNVKLPVVYDEIRSAGRVKYQGLWGVVREGKQIIPCEYLYLGVDHYFFSPLSNRYDSYDSFEPSQYKNGKWGVINIYNGEIILEFEFDEINHYRGDYYEIRKVDKWGAFNKGELIYPCEFTLEEIKKKRF